MNSKLALINSTLTPTEMVLLSVVLAYLLHKKRIPLFFRRIGYLLILSDMAYAFNQMGTLYEQNQHRNRVGLNYFIATLMGVSGFLWYGAAGLVHWLFAFRYWIIAEEAPFILTQQYRQMAIDEVKKRESTYKVIQRAGTVLNLLMSFLAGLMRFFLSIQVTMNKNGGANATTVVLAMIFNALTILLQLASGILLLYALMKLSNSVGNVPGAKQKRGSFIAHFAVLVFHLLTLALCQFYIQRG